MSYARKAQERYRRGMAPYWPAINPLGHVAADVDEAIRHGESVGLTEDRAREILAEELMTAQQNGWAPSSSVRHARERMTSEGSAVRSPQGETET